MSVLLQLISFASLSGWGWLWLVALLALLSFAATLLSIYNQEKKIPSFERVWRTMVVRISHIPSSLSHRVRSAPHRAKHSLTTAKARFFHSLAKRLAFLLPAAGKKQRSSGWMKWIASHHIPLDESMLFPVKSNAKSVSLADALLLHPPLKRVHVDASHVELRFSSRGWNAFEVHAHHFRIWAVSRKKMIPKRFVAELQRYARGVYFVVK
jgi:hypothetical protein